MSLNSLDDVCLFELFKLISFKKLFKLRILNRRFYYLIKEYLQSIRHVEFNNDADDDREINHDQLLRTGNKMNVFKFKELNDMNKLVTANFFYFHNLVTLKLINLEFNESSFSFLIDQPFVGKTLMHFIVYKCNFQMDEQHELDCWESFLSRAGAALKSLVLIKNRMNTNPLLTRIAFYCRKLTILSLDLNQFYCLNDCFVDKIDKLNRLNKLNKQNKLDNNLYSFFNIPISDLRLYGSRKEYFSSNIGKIIDFSQIQVLSLDCVPVSNCHLIDVFNNLHNIRILKFVLNSNHRVIDDFHTDLALAIATRPFLEQLHLLESRENVLVDELFQALIPLINNRLKVLEIQNGLLNDYTFELICNSLTNLNSLHINSFAPCFIGSVFFSIRLSKRTKRNDLVGNLVKLKNLTHLSLIFTMTNDEELNRLLEEFGGNLTDLVLDGCLELTIETIRNVCEYASINSNKNYTLTLSSDLYNQIEHSIFQFLPQNLKIFKNSNLTKYNKM